MPAPPPAVVTRVPLHRRPVGLVLTSRSAHVWPVTPVLVLALVLSVSVVGVASTGPSTGQLVAYLAALALCLAVSAAILHRGRTSFLLGGQVIAAGPLRPGGNSTARRVPTLTLQCYSYRCGVVLVAGRAHRSYQPPTERTILTGASGWGTARPLRVLAAVAEAGLLAEATTLVVDEMPLSPRGSAALRRLERAGVAVERRWSR